MCLDDVGVLLFDGLWGTEKLLFLFLLAVANIAYAACRSPKTPTGDLTLRRRMRMLAVQDALKLMISEIVLLFSVRAALAFLPVTAGPLIMDILAYVLFTTLFFTILNHMVADLESLSERGVYVGGVLKGIRMLTAFMLSKQDKALYDTFQKEVKNGNTEGSSTAKAGGRNGVA